MRPPICLITMIFDMINMRCCIAGVKGQLILNRACKSYWSDAKVNVMIIKTLCLSLLSPQEEALRAPFLNLFCFHWTSLLLKAMCFLLSLLCWQYSDLSLTLITSATRSVSLSVHFNSMLIYKATNNTNKATNNCGLTTFVLVFHPSHGQ